MDKLSFISEVYEQITEVFLRGFSDDLYEKAQKAYLEWLHQEYDKYFMNATDDELNTVASMCAKKEKIIHLDKSVEAKCAFLFPDENYEKLELLSLEIATLIRDKKEKRSINKSKEEYLAELKQLFSSVTEDFKYSAEKMYSEAILDLRCLYDDEKKEYSFRKNE